VSEPIEAFSSPADEDLVMAPGSSINAEPQLTDAGDLHATQFVPTRLCHQHFTEDGIRPLKSYLEPSSCPPPGPQMYVAVEQDSECLACYKVSAADDRLELVLRLPLQFAAVRQVGGEERHLLGVVLPVPEAVPDSLRIDSTGIEKLLSASASDGVWMFEFETAILLQGLSAQLQSAGCAMQGFEDRYQLGNLLGMGSFSKVFYAEDKRTGLQFAAKMIRKVDAVKDANLMKEVSIMRRACHPCVLKFHGLFSGLDPVEGKHVWIILTEFLGGGELFGRVRTQGHISETRAAIITMQLLSALRCLHQRGFVHRDIKTENVILVDSQKDEVKLVDFGLATPESDETSMKTKCGSPGYIAPEVLRNEKYGCKVDCFSVGVLLYILLVGRGPFRGKSIKEMLDQNRKCQVKLKNLAHLSKDARDLVLRLLSPFPQVRPTADQALDHPWFAQAASGSQDILSNLLHAERERAGLSNFCSLVVEGKPEGTIVFSPRPSENLPQEMPESVGNSNGRREEVPESVVNSNEAWEGPESVAMTDEPILRSETPVFADMQCVITALREHGMSPGNSMDQSRDQGSQILDFEDHEDATSAAHDRFSGRFTGVFSDRLSACFSPGRGNTERTSHYFTRDVANDSDARDGSRRDLSENVLRDLTDYNARKSSRRSERRHSSGNLRGVECLDAEFDSSGGDSDKLSKDSGGRTRKHRKADSKVSGGGTRNSSEAVLVDPDLSDCIFGEWPPVSPRARRPSQSKPFGSVAGRRPAQSKSVGSVAGAPAASFLLAAKCLLPAVPQAEAKSSDVIVSKSIQAPSPPPRLLDSSATACDKGTFSRGARRPGRFNVPD